MQDDFIGSETINLQVGDRLTKTFEVTSESASGAADGKLPFNRWTTSVGVSAIAEDGTTQASDIIWGSPTVTKSTSTSDLITVPLKYPTLSGTGRYTLKFILTLDNGHKKGLLFPRVKTVT